MWGAVRAPRGQLISMLLLSVALATAQARAEPAEDPPVMLELDYSLLPEAP